ncbi:M14 family zinc carboxypeptidase [Streptomyces sp. NPDC051572]|uniref:M14 family zinc carboxypeptidase n=1 Tax=Streptomyces sp. NPDC051572 TaxID=3155802 RepID=UPI00344BCF9E
MFSTECFEEFPDHTNRYPTVAEVTESTRQLVARYPESCRPRRIGRSRAGRPIPMLSVGHGQQHALVVAGPHPDKPVGGATALVLAEQPEWAPIVARQLPESEPPFETIDALRPFLQYSLTAPMWAAAGSS